VSSMPTCKNKAMLELQNLVATAPRTFRLGAFAKHATARSAPRWAFCELIGRVVELSTEGTSGASLTLAMELVVQAQQEGEQVAWIVAQESTFFPPDAAGTGVDLDSLVVVRALGAKSAGRAADKLLRSGGFGLVVMDLGDGVAAGLGLTPALQGRLQGLAHRHRSTLLCLTDKRPDAPSLGPGISLRVASRRCRERDLFVCELFALKDRQHAPGWTHREVFRGPPGLR